MSHEYYRDKARQYVVVGLIFFLFTFFGVFYAWYFIVFYVNPNPMLRPVVSSFELGIYVVLIAIFGIAGYISYTQIGTGSYSSARKISLILGVFGLWPFFGFIGAGVCFLLAYRKLGLVQQSTHPSLSKIPSATVSPTFCPSCGSKWQADDQYCGICGTNLLD